MNTTLPDILKRESIDSLITTATQVIEDKVDIVEGCRLMLRYATSGGVVEDEIFLSIRGFVDQTEHFLVGKARDQAEKGYLDKLDIEKEALINDFKEEIVKDCKIILDKYSLV